MIKKIIKWFIPKRFLIKLSLFKNVALKYGNYNLVKKKSVHAIVI